MVWAGFDAKGKTSFAFIKTKMNFFDYQDILGNIFFLLKDELKDQNLVLFQDDAYIHKSVPTSDWLSANSIKTLDTLAKSPDLNSIKNLWGTLVRQVYAIG